MSIKFLVLGGGAIWVRGGECRFYFYGRGDFSDYLEAKKEHLGGSLVHMHFSFFPLKNKLFDIHQTPLLPVEALEFSDLKTPLVYTFFRRLFVTCGVFTRDFFVAFPWLFRGPLLSRKTVFGPFSWFFRGFFVAPVLGKIYAYSP